MGRRVKPRKINAEEMNLVLSLKREDITSTKLKELFGVDAFDKTPKFQPNDQFTLPIGRFHNKTSIDTTVGRYIYNMFCIPENTLKKFGYFNIELDEDNIKGLEGKMGSMILNDELTTKQYAEWMDNSEWLGMSVAYYLSPSLSNAVIVPIPEVIERKEELFSQYKKELADGDLNAANKVEKELIGMAKDKMNELDDPSYDCYKSGVFSFNNAYKKCSIMVGAISDPYTGKLSILKSNYNNGVSKDEYDKTGSLTVLGGTSRGVFTQKYGYESKKYNASLQNVAVDIDGSNVDCGTTKYLTITIPKDLKSMFMYRYVIDGSKLVELLPDNIDNYVGKEVKLRSPMYCKSDNICEHCAGTLFKRMTLKEVGMVCSNLTGNLLNLSMKKMHDSTVKINKIDLEKFIIEH